MNDDEKSVEELGIDQKIERLIEKRSDLKRKRWKAENPKLVGKFYYRIKGHAEHVYTAVTGLGWECSLEGWWFIKDLDTSTIVFHPGEDGLLELGFEISKEQFMTAYQEALGDITNAGKET